LRPTCRNLRLWRWQWPRSRASCTRSFLSRRPTCAMEPLPSWTLGLSGCPYSVRILYFIGYEQLNEKHQELELYEITRFFTMATTSIVAPKQPGTSHFCIQSRKHGNFSTVLLYSLFLKWIDHFVQHLVLQVHFTHPKFPGAVRGSRKKRIPHFVTAPPTAEPSP
jgi:hypothetical protein